MRTAAILFFLTVFSGAFAQKGRISSAEEFAKEITAVSQQLNQNNMLVKYNKRFFTDSVNMKDPEISKGFILRGTGNSYMMNENGSLVIQNEKELVMADSANKVLLLKDMDSIPNAFDMNALMANKADRTIIRSESAGIVTYTILSETDNFSSASVSFKKAGNKLLQMIFVLQPYNYSSESLEDETIETPVMIIDFTEIKTIKTTAEDFSMKKLFTEEKGKMQFIGKYQAYTFYDNRLPK